MTSEIHVGDIGTTFIITIKDEDDNVVDISTATIKNLIFEKPDGSILTKAGSFYTDGTDGKIKYSSVADDLDSHGVWHLQAYVAISTGSWYSDVHNFRVYKNLGC